MGPTENAADVATELRHATTAHRDAQEVAVKSSKRWKRAVVDAIDAGMGQAVVAELAGVTRARVHAIIVGDYS